MPTPTPIKLSLPVTVLLERRIISRSFWSVPSWYLHTVAVGNHLSADDRAVRGPEQEQEKPLAKAATGESASAVVCMAAGKTDKGELFAWTGFQVRFYKDACERYWHALIGNQALVYVVCRENAGNENDDGESVNVRPAFVTIDYDEAVAALETDGLVLSAPIPVELYRYMEEFVLQHYRPKRLKKRKRKNWSDDL